MLILPSAGLVVVLLMSLQALLNHVRAITMVKQRPIDKKAVYSILPHMDLFWNVRI